MEQAVWQTGPGRSLASDMGEFQLIVERLDGWVRYRVLRRNHQADPGPVLLASGNQDDVRGAMDAAERVARLAGRRWPAGERAA